MIIGELLYDNYKDQHSAGIKIEKVEDGFEIDRPLYEIEEEIAEANKILLEWAKKLEPYSKDNKNKKVTI